MMALISSLSVGVQYVQSTWDVQDEEVVAVMSLVNLFCYIYGTEEGHWVLKLVHSQKNGVKSPCCGETLMMNPISVCLGNAGDLG